MIPGIVASAFALPAAPAIAPVSTTHLMVSFPGGRSDAFGALAQLRIKDAQGTNLIGGTVGTDFTLTADCNSQVGNVNNILNNTPSSYWMMSPYSGAGKRTAVRFTWPSAVTPALFEIMPPPNLNNAVNGAAFYTSSDGGTTWDFWFAAAWDSVAADPANLHQITPPYEAGISAGVNTHCGLWIQDRDNTGVGYVKVRETTFRLSGAVVCGAGAAPLSTWETNAKSSLDTADQLVDGAADYWQPRDASSTQYGALAKFEMAAASAVDSVDLTAGPDGSHVANGEFLVGDGSTFVSVAAIRNQTGWSANETRTFT